MVKRCIAVAIISVAAGMYYAVQYLGPTSETYDVIGAVVSEPFCGDDYYNGIKCRVILDTGYHVTVYQLVLVGDNIVQHCKYYNVEKTHCWNYVRGPQQ